MSIFPDQVLVEPEANKKAGDLQFARGQFEEAIKLYRSALEYLERLKGYPLGEIITMRASANAAACHLKLNQYEQVVELCTAAVKVGSSTSELHLLGKLHHRRATALEALGDFEAALLSLDECIRIELSAMPEEPEESPHSKWRDELVTKVVEKRDGVVSVPPEPKRITSVQVEETILAILQNGCNTKHKDMMKKVRTLVETRGYVDTKDSQVSMGLGGYGNVSILLMSYFMRSGALGSPDLLISYSILSEA